MGYLRLLLNYERTMRARAPCTGVAAVKLEIPRRANYGGGTLRI